MSNVRVVTESSHSWNIKGGNFDFANSRYAISYDQNDLIPLRDELNRLFPVAPIVSNGPQVTEPVRVNGTILHALCIAENDDDYAAAFDYLRERGVVIV